MRPAQRRCELAPIVGVKGGLGGGAGTEKGSGHLACVESYEGRGEGRYAWRRRTASHSLEKDTNQPKPLSHHPCARKVCSWQQIVYHPLSPPHGIRPTKFEERLAPPHRASHPTQPHGEAHGLAQPHTASHSLTQPVTLHSLTAQPRHAIAAQPPAQQRQTVATQPTAGPHCAQQVSSQRP